MRRPIILAATITLLASSACTRKATGPAPDLTTDAAGLSKTVVVMKTSRGTLKFRFYPKAAPLTVAHVAELINEKFYNGLSFHRVDPGFCVQTGDPKSRNKNDPTVGDGGSGSPVKGEFAHIVHHKGTVGMARGKDPDSADSQFYITLSAAPQLDLWYTVFGEVVDFGEKVGGKDVLERIQKNDDLIEMHLE